MVWVVRGAIFSALALVLALVFEIKLRENCLMHLFVKARTNRNGFRAQDLGGTNGQMDQRW